MFTRIKFAAVLILVCGARIAGAGVPIAEQLLPTNTLACFTIPNMVNARRDWNQSRAGELWRDSAMRPFREHLAAQVVEPLLGPAEAQAGFRLWDFIELSEGQVTFALLDADFLSSKTERLPMWVFVADCGSRSNRLADLLASATRRRQASSLPISTQRIGGIEFTSLTVPWPGDEAAPALAAGLAALKPGPSGSASGSSAAAKDSPNPRPAGEPAGKRVIFGRVGAVLVMANNRLAIEPVLARLPGTNQVRNSLADHPEYASAISGVRSAAAFGWVHFQPALGAWMQNPSVVSNKAKSPLIPTPARAAAALGLSDLASIAFALRLDASSAKFQTVLHAPEPKRKGLLRLLSLTQHEAVPPPYVPADVARFHRWRLDGPSAWSTIESAIGELSPQLGGILQMSVSAIGKDHDLKFDFRRDFVSALGADWIWFELAPTATASKGASQAGVESLERREASPQTADRRPPTAVESLTHSQPVSGLKDSSREPRRMMLVAATNQTGFINGLRALTSLLPVSAEATGIREWVVPGGKIHAMAVPYAEPADTTTESQAELYFAWRDGYFGFSRSQAMVEDFLTNGLMIQAEGAGPRRIDEAIARLGTRPLGMFAWEDHRHTARPWLERMRAGTGDASGTALIGGLTGSSGDEFAEWFGLRLLPSHESIGKYLDSATTQIHSSADAISIELTLLGP